MENDIIKIGYTKSNNNLINKKMNQLEIKQINQLETEMIKEGLYDSLDLFTAQDLLDIVHDRIVEKFNNS